MDSAELWILGARCPCDSNRYAIAAPLGNLPMMLFFGQSAVISVRPHIPKYSDGKVSRGCYREDCA